MLWLLMIAILATQLILIAGGVYVYRKSRELVRQSREVLQGVFIPQVDGQSSAFGEAIDQVTDSFSQKIGVTVQAALRGSWGGTLKAVNKELEIEGAAVDPTAAALNALPKSIKKNPVAMIGLQSIIGKFLQGQSSSPGVFMSGSNGQAKFNL